MQAVVFDRKMTDLTTERSDSPCTAFDKGIFMREIRISIESYVAADERMQIFGWSAAGLFPENTEKGCAGELSEPEVFLLSRGRKLSADQYHLERIYRRDVNRVCGIDGKDYRAGFRLDIFLPPQKKWFPLTLVFADGSIREERRIVYNEIYPYVLAGMHGVRRLIGKSFYYLKTEGIRGVFSRVKKRLTHIIPQQQIPYGQWRLHTLPSEKVLEAQRTAEFSERPLLSVVIPVYRTNPEFLRELVDSIRASSYDRWELCFADGSADENGDSPMTELLQELAASDRRIRFQTLDHNLGIAGNTNAAIAMAQGELIAFSDHDDLLTPDAFYEVVKAYLDNGKPDFLYSDQDMVSTDGKTYYEPNFKPDFSMDYLCSVNYICHLTVITRRLADQVGGLSAEFDGAQDYDYTLRCCENAQGIVHIPKVLYHWRAHELSTAGNPQSKRYAFDAGRRAVEAHYERVGIPAEVQMTKEDGTYRTIYRWKEEPLVSILIPNKDHAEDLARCVDSLFEKSTYSNFEIIIIENSSEDPETFDYYETLKAEHDHVTVCVYEGGFNFSAINNYGAQFAQGEYLLLLNNDTEMISDGIRELLGPCMRDDVGITGARLYYPDGTIQHAGVVIGYSGIAGHTFIGAGADDSGYMKRIISMQNYSAVTAACMMVSRTAFEAAGGLDEEYAVAFNDIDFCMKVRQAGYLIVYNPWAEFFHYESKSRGYEDTPDKKARFETEIRRFRERWPQYFEKGDPYYNPNLTLKKSDFSLKDYEGGEL